MLNKKQSCLKNRIAQKKSGCETIAVAFVLSSYFMVSRMTRYILS